MALIRDFFLSVFFTNEEQDNWGLVHSSQQSQTHLNECFIWGAGGGVVPVLEAGMDWSIEGRVLIFIFVIFYIYIFYIYILYLYLFTIGYQLSWNRSLPPARVNELSAFSIIT